MLDTVKQGGAKMAIKNLVFQCYIKIWEDTGEYIVEYHNGDYRSRVGREYYSKSRSIPSAVESLFRELVEDGVIPLTQDSQNRQDDQQF